jgi:hypothetical protein
MSNYTFAEGLEVYYKNYYGVIRFVCDEYLTVCIRKFDNEKSRDVCMIVYPQQYHIITLVKASTK